MLPIHSPRLACGVDGAPTQVLFVDDEVAVLDGLRRSLDSRPRGWQATFVGDPRQALALSRQRRFDLVVTDIRMPVIDGISMIEAMRGDSPWLLTIVLSGVSDFGTAVDALNRAGALRYLCKPCSVDALCGAIDAALDAAASSVPLRAAFEHLSVAVMVVDAEGVLQIANRRGSALLDAGTVLRRGVGGAVVTSSPAHADALRRAIRAAAGGEGDDVLALPGIDGRVALSLGFSGHARGATIYAHEPGGVPLPGHLAKLLGLTPSEAGLAHALALAGGLEEAARLRGLTLATARTYLKVVFAKTGTRRQADLVRLVMGQPRLHAVQASALRAS